MTLAGPATPAHRGRMRAMHRSWHLALIAAMVLALRLPLVYDQPYTDEGIYTAWGYFNFLTYTGTLPTAGWMVARDGTLGLYTLLTSWVHFLPWQPLVVLRLIDAGMAVMAAALLYRFLCSALEHRPAALAGALVLALGLNHPLFINAGFKNPIPVALTLLVLAMHTLYLGGRHAAARAGVCCALAVLFRELFLPMAAVLTFYATYRQGWRGLCVFVAAGITTGAAVVGASVLARGGGGLDGLLEAYASFDASIPLLSSRLPATAEQGLAALTVLMPLLPLSVLGLVRAWPGRSARAPRTTELWCLALLLTLSPVPEILYKWAFPYHFSQTVLGLCLFAGLGWRLATAIPLPGEGHRPFIAGPKVCGGVAVLSLLLGGPYLRQCFWHADAARRFIPVMWQQDWSSPATQQSLYLRAAAAIRQSSAPRASMMTEVYSTVLFPLTGRLPTATGLGNGTRVALRGNPDQRAANHAQLLASPPDVLVLIPRHGPGDEVPAFLVDLSSRYAASTRFAEGISPYGGWSTEIYFRTPAGPVR